MVSGPFPVPRLPAGSRGSVTTAAAEPRAGATVTTAGPRCDYGSLSRQLRAAGLLSPQVGYYRARIGVVVGLWAGGWVVFALLGPSWWQLAVAAVMAVVFAQIGFLGHDAGHQQVYASRRANDLLGLVCANALIGLSYGWWIDKHNRHHAHPNHVDRDPDIGGVGIAFTAAQARARSSRLGRWLARHQAATFFPLLLLEGLDLHLSSVRGLYRRRGERTRGWWTESVLLAGHFTGYLTAVFLVLPAGQAIAFIAVHQGLLGVYLGCSFAPAHKGMPLIGEPDASETEEAERGLDFVHRQVLTSRNITGGRWLDVAMGGLNYQIEHHLFPTVPTVRLRRAQPAIRAFCAANELPYQESTLAGSYALVLRSLRDTGALAGPGATEPSIEGEPGPRTTTGRSSTDASGDTRT